jgi:hypothetical protein
MEKNCVIKSSIFVLFTEFYSDEQTKENEVDGACGNTAKRRKASMDFVGEQEIKFPPGRLRRR